MVAVLFFLLAFERTLNGDFTALIPPAKSEQQEKVHKPHRNCDADFKLTMGHRRTSRELFYLPLLEYVEQLEATWPTTPGQRRFVAEITKMSHNRPPSCRHRDHHDRKVERQTDSINPSLLSMILG